MKQTLSYNYKFSNIMNESIMFILRGKHLTTSRSGNRILLLESLSTLLGRVLTYQLVFFVNYVHICCAEMSHYCHISIKERISWIEHSFWTRSHAFSCFKSRDLYIRERGQLRVGDLSQSFFACSQKINRQPGKLHCAFFIKEIR